MKKELHNNIRISNNKMGFDVQICDMAYEIGYNTTAYKLQERLVYVLEAKCKEHTIGEIIDIMYSHGDRRLRNIWVEDIWLAYILSCVFIWMELKIR